MFSLLKWFAPVAAFGILSAFCFVTVRADDAATGVTAADTGSVTVTVNDDAGNPVPDAKVNVVAPHKEASAPTTQPQDAERHKGHGKPDVVASGTTDAQGTVTLSGIPAGKYRVVAHLKGVGKGHEKVEITAGGTASVTITLKKHEKNA
jgi:protocatechuate 3,4-dioxygenase beta subunit